jgi:hypothetical protein
MMAFHVGQTVCCISDGPWGGITFGLESPGPRKKQVLLVREVCSDADGPWLGFDEFHTDFGQRRLFRTKHFRPIVERKTSIEIFQRMLKPTDKRVDA